MCLMLICQTEKIRHVLCACFTVAFMLKKQIEFTVGARCSSLPEVKCSSRCVLFCAFSQREKNQGYSFDYGTIKDG